MGATEHGRPVIKIDVVVPLLGHDGIAEDAPVILIKKVVKGITIRIQNDRDTVGIQKDVRGLQDTGDVVPVAVFQTARRKSLRHLRNVKYVCVLPIERLDQ